MEVSVILPTNRPIGSMYALHALSKQTFPQKRFELLIVDDYKDDREQFIVETSEKLGVQNVKVLHSKPNYWRSNRLIANARNTALIKAEGELVVFLDDFCWVRQGWLREHWRTYERGYCMLGAMKTVRYVPNVYEDLDQLPPPKEGENYWDEREALRWWETHEQKVRTKEVRHFWSTDSRGVNSMRNCWGGWLYSCNASAPLDKLIEINGFEERYDQCSEEDIDLGLRLERMGMKFWYRPDRECTVFHMDHRTIDREMKDWPKRYRKITYDELRERGTLETEPDEIQLIMKEAYNAKYDGSWGLHEWMRKRPPVANVVNGKKIFDLRVERERVRNA